MKATGARKATVIGQDQPDVEGPDGERSASPISQFSPTPPPQKTSPPVSIRSVRSTTKTTRSFVQTIKGATKAATYAIGQGKPSSSKAEKAKQMDTSLKDERDITLTKHHATKAGDLQASILAQEEAIFERVANWTPPNNDHLVANSRLQPILEDMIFAGGYYTANLNTQIRKYTFTFQLTFHWKKCRNFKVPTCILKYLTNAGSESNPHWILAGDANPFIPVHRVGVNDDDALGESYNSPEPIPSAERRKVKHEEEAHGLLTPHDSHEALSGGPAVEANVSQVTRDWGVSPATTYRTPSMGAIESLTRGDARKRSMSPHRYLSPTPVPTGPTPLANQLAVYPQVNTPFSSLVIPQGERHMGSVRGQPDQIDSAGNRYSFGVSQSPVVPDNNWHVFARSEDRNVALKGQNITETLINGVNGKKHIPTPYGKGDNVYVRSWDDVIVVSKEEYKKAGGRSGHFKSKTYGSDTISDVPQAAFVDEGDAKSWAEWSVEAMRNITFINDFGHYDAIA
ncbi:hypothetical protein AX16_006093 [Volvariella volvacea WC 439]|nr:hypothetical protein AX16_006093 [Volvariella volvacea WC 439]